MNYLEIKLAPQEYPRGIHIESDDEALNAYNKLSESMTTGAVVEVVLNGAKTTVRGSNLNGVGLTPSSVITEQQRRQEAEMAKYQAQTAGQWVGAGLVGNATNRTILS